MREAVSSKEYVAIEAQLHQATMNGLIRGLAYFFFIVLVIFLEVIRRFFDLDAPVWLYGTALLSACLYCGFDLRSSIKEIKSLQEKLNQSVPGPIGD